VILLLRVTRAGEVSAYVLLTLVGLAAAVGGSRYGIVVDNGRVGPGLVPTVSGGLLCLLGIALTLRAVLDGAGRDHARGGDAGLPDDGTGGEGMAAEDVDLSGRTPVQRVRQLWIVFGLLLVAILAVNLIGFLVSFGLLVLVISVWLERRGVVVSLAVTVGACALIYVVFELFLRVPLPPGLIGI
jgi:hypothetical protein